MPSHSTPSIFKGSLSGQPLEDIGEESTAEGGDPIALLSPVLPQDDVVYEGANDINLYNTKADPFIYQTHVTTIFEHKLKVDDCELSEFMEKVVITKRDPMYPEDDTVENVLLHRRKMDNSELIIKTVATQKDEIVDYNVKTNVYMNEGSSVSSRSMSKDELKRFKLSWRKLWRPNHSDDDLHDYALLDTEMQPNINALNPLTNKMATGTKFSRALESNMAGQVQSKRKSRSVVSRSSNNRHRSTSRKSSDKRQGSNEGQTQKDPEPSLDGTGWETYVEQSQSPK